MSARRLLGVVGLFACCAFGTAAAQTGVRFQVQYLLNDSIVVGEPGADIPVDLYAYDGRGYGLHSFTLQIPFDASKLAITAVQTLCPDSTPITLTPGPGYVQLSASSCGTYPYGQSFARLTLHLLPGVTDGTIAGLQVLALTDASALDRTLDAATDFVQICHASGRWGDIDNDAAVNSRDALIALSNAVGIPTGAFNVSRGDVDGDNQVTSRDALLMLSNSIGLYTGGYRVGLGIPDACAPQPVLPRELYFMRDGPSPGVAGVSGLAIRAANDSSITIPGDSADVQAYYQGRPRVSPDGSSVLFICYNNTGYPVACKANADGSGRVELTNDFNIDQSPDWSPAGDSIVYVSANQIYIMGADGSNPRLVSGTYYPVSSVAWRPGSRMLAYTNVSGYGMVRTIDLDTGLDATLLDANSLPGLQQYPRFVDWNAAGDSVYFDFTFYYQYMVASLPATPGPAYTTRVSLVNGASEPLWTSQGLLFVTSWNGYPRIVLAKSDGTYAIVSHDSHGHQAPGMKRQ